MVTSDEKLLQEYVTGRSEEAFATLVARYVNLVYSAALRQVGNPQLAEEVSQAVFVILARKARAFGRGVVLAGWLYQTARLTAANSLRGEIRRQRREQEAHVQSTLNAPEPESWPQVGPLLDEAMGSLSEKDRNAVVLRYFENKPMREIGAALGTSDDAAKMRLSRALDKLREFFARRGVTTTSAGLATLMAEHSIQAAPAGLAASAAAAAGGASALSLTTATLAKGTLN